MKRTNLEVGPFRLPLDREEFRAALQKGLGRASVEVAQFGVVDREDLIVEACLRAVGYDPQWEDERTEWLLQMIDCAGIEAAVVPPVLDALGAGFVEKPHWDKFQLCRFALAFAKRGHPAAREALYAAMHKHPRSSDIFAAEEIIQLDGSDGVIFVADKLGDWILGDPGLSAEFDVLEFYDETHGEGSAQRILRSAASDNPRIAAFLDHADGGSESIDGKLAPKQGTIQSDILVRFDRVRESPFEAMRHWTAARIIGDIRETDAEKNTSRFLHMRWGDEASEEDLALVFEELCEERDQARIRLLLSVFQRRGFLETNARALQFAESDDSQIRWSIYGCLASHRHDEVRALALRRIRAGRMVEGELGLLVKNYRIGDWLTIRESLPRPDDPSDLHRMLQDLLDIFAENRSRDSFHPLLIVYEHTPCSLCRERAVKAMVQLSALPDWVREECRFDANEDTRDLVATP